MVSYGCSRRRRGRIEVGPQAEKVAHKDLNPKSRMEKLGVKEGGERHCNREMEAEFEAELTKVTPGFVRGAIAKDTEFIFLTAETEKELARATNIARGCAEGPLCGLLSERAQGHYGKIAC